MLLLVHYLTFCPYEANWMTLYQNALHPGNIHSQNINGTVFTYLFVLNAHETCFVVYNMLIL
jgi:hypothetical protein